MKNKNEENKFKNEMIKDIIAALIPCFVILLIEIIFKVGTVGVLYVFWGEPKSFIFSILIGYLIYGILFGITKKLSTSTIIVSIIGTLLLIVNQMKMVYAGEPIYFSDINFITNVGNIFKLVQSNFIVFMKEYMYILITLICSFYFIIRWTRNNERKITNIKVRIGLAVSCIIILFVLYMPNKYTKDIFLDMFLNNTEHTDYNSYTTNNSYYCMHSLLAGMYGVLLNNRFDVPEDYNEEELNNILELASKEETNGNLGQPNIVVLFSESFWDIDKQEDVKFNKEIASNIKQLSTKAKKVETLTCAYGGMSENVAFELLTGGSLKFFTKGYIPMVSLYKNEKSTRIPSIVKELKNNGYTSEIIFGKDYYNSEKSMKRLGFDQYEELEEKAERIKGGYISDEYMVDVIIDKLKNKTNKEKMFLMAETIQNHMPYNLEKYKEYDISIKESTLPDKMNNSILSYAQGIHDADKQLKRLYDYVEKYEEPTIILFLGDHLPYLHSESGKNQLESISYFNTGNDIEDVYRKYNTQTLILANYELDLNDIPNYLSNNFILTYIVNNMDIVLSPYYRWLYSTMNILPASNSYVSIDRDGNKYNNQELNENMQFINKLREHMQYKFFIKSIE